MDNDIPIHPHCRCELTSPLLYSFRIYAEDVSLDACQRLFERAFLDYRADPKYLFVSKQSKAKLFLEVINGQYHMEQSWQEARRELGFPQKYLDGYPIPHDIYAISNFTTGRIVPVVALPNLDDNQVILGFLRING